MSPPLRCRWCLSVSHASDDCPQPDQSRGAAALYHYCCEHSVGQIGAEGELVSTQALRPDVEVPWPGWFVWMTDMARPARTALGLTSDLLACDRLARRYIVVDPGAQIHWSFVRRALSRLEQLSVEAAPGARPMHWWVSQEPVAVRLDQSYGRGTRTVEAREGI